MKKVLIIVSLLLLAVLLISCAAKLNEGFTDKLGGLIQDVVDSEPPADETDPPTDDTEPPTDETESPTEETDPPTDETEPPADETDPPTEETDPSTEETDPPTDGDDTEVRNSLVGYYQLTSVGSEDYSWGEQTISGTYDDKEFFSISYNSGDEYIEFLDSDGGIVDYIPANYIDNFLEDPPVIYFGTSYQTVTSSFYSWFTSAFTRYYPANYV